MDERVVMETNLVLPFVDRGKVKDIYRESKDKLFMVFTDRISAFDEVMKQGIPGKGKILNRLSAFWFRYLEDIIENHLISIDLSEPEFSFIKKNFYSWVLERSMAVWEAERIPIECVVRGYLAGSAWKEYQAAGTVCGTKPPSGLLEGSKLPEPIFTPATKAPKGEHDRNLTLDEACDIVGKETATKLQEKSLELYLKGEKYARARGVIVADTKFEFGNRCKDGKLMLIDEVFTPDSSRFWPVEDYQPGGPQKSLDKQFLRDWLESSGWNKKPPPPTLPPEIIQRIKERYQEAEKRLLTP